MTVAALPASQCRSLSLPTARRSTTALTRPRPKISAKRAAPTPNPRLPTAYHACIPTRLRASALRPDVRVPRIAIDRAHQTAIFPARGFLLTRLSDAAPRPDRAPAKGQRPKPLSEADGRSAPQGESGAHHKSPHPGPHRRDLPSVSRQGRRHHRPAFVADTA